MYAKCTLIMKFTKDKDDELKKKNEELEALVSQLPSQRIEDIETQIEKIYGKIRIIESNKERIGKRFSLFRENLALKIGTLEQQIEEFLKAKTSFEKFVYSDLSAVEIAAYGLCALLRISKGVRDSWYKSFESLKTNFDDCMTHFSA